MKKSSLLVASTFLLALLASCGQSSNTSSSSSVVSSSAVPSSSSVVETIPIIASHETRKVPVYSQGSVTPTMTAIVHHFNGSKVAYVDLGVANQMVDNQLSMFKITSSGNQTYITNGLGSCTIDFAKQTLTYNNFDGYCIYDVDDYVPYNDPLTKGSKSFFVKNLATSTYQGSVEERVINFKKYSIPLYMENGVGYVPLETLFPYAFPVASLPLFYNGQAIYTYNVTSTQEILDFIKTRDQIDLPYMEYAYNLFAMNLDEKFGLDKKILSGTTAYEYLKDGAYAALAPYHDRMVSLEPGSYDAAVFEFFSKELVDGGHTMPTSISGLYGNKAQLVYGDYIHAGWDFKAKLKEARAATAYDPAAVVYDQVQTAEAKAEVEAMAQAGAAVNCYQEIGDVAFITFDSFVNAETKPTTLDVNNYFKNTVYLVSYANQQIREHNIKNLVVDISINGGGSAAAEQFIASWLCNGVTTKVRNTLDKTFSVQTNYADVDFDGDYDANDYLPEDVNLYCLTTSACFSCGNLLPFQLHEERNTTLIGEKTGGGSCVVDASLCLAYGFSYQASGCNQLGTMASTSYSDFTSLEEGVSPDVALSTADENLAAYYNRDALISSYVKKAA